MTILQPLMKIMDVDNGHQQLLKASGEKLVGGKQCSISAKTESRLMEQKKKSGMEPHLRVT